MWKSIIHAGFAGGTMGQSTFGWGVAYRTSLSCSAAEFLYIWRLPHPWYVCVFITQPKARLHGIALPIDPQYTLPVYECVAVKPVDLEAARTETFAYSTYKSSKTINHHQLRLAFACTRKEMEIHLCLGLNTGILTIPLISACSYGGRKKKWH